jgi:type I restriction enzyme S subunit
MENGKAAIARNLNNGLGFGSTEFHVLRSNNVVLPEYIFSFIRLKAFRERAASAFVGTGGLQRVPTDFLSRVKIHFPHSPNNSASSMYCNRRRQRTIINREVGILI